MMNTDGPIEKALRDGGIFPALGNGPALRHKAGMTRAEIIVKSLEEAGLLSLTERDSQCGKKIGRIRSVVAGLQRRLPEGEITTCGGFRVIGVACCNRYHSDPLGRMKLVELPEGSKGWFCCGLAAACSPVPSARCQEAKLDPLEGVMPTGGCGEVAPEGSA